MEIIEKSILYIQKHFPEVNTSFIENGVIFQGRFVLNVRNGDFEINIAPLLEITLPQEYPSVFPIVKDLDGTIKYDHVNRDSSLCVATVIDFLSPNSL
ncbi:hypothetical protein FACS189491_01730 [Spirochaetia bacterium]|nr:hypothetical protein FACS189491_01730 [Spirochaetia bacterium]